MTEPYIPAGLTPEPTPNPVPVQQPIQQQQTTPPAPTQSSSLPPIPKRGPGIVSKIVPFLIAIGGIAVGIGIFAFYQTTLTKDQPVPTPTVTQEQPTLSPTPYRLATSISTSSGFLSLESDIGSLSSQLKEFSKDDPSLNPPSLVLPVGF